MSEEISREEISRTLAERPEIYTLFKIIMAQPIERQAEYSEIARKYIESKTKRV